MFMVKDLENLQQIVTGEKKMDFFNTLERISTNYKIEKEIGRGGMGIVYLATDERLERQVAIKVLNMSFMEDCAENDTDDIIERFNREAKAVANLSHPNIVNIYDIGSENDLNYMVMEYIEGIDLSKIKAKKIELSLKQIINIGIQICNALSFAHSKGIVHRDIKPANIILTSSNIVKLMDFGIAQLNQEGYKRLTQDGSVLGSIMYISPEQLSNSALTDKRTDIYSIGITLFELLTGCLPFEADNIADVVMKVLRAKPVPPSSHNQQIPEFIDKIILKALEKDCTKRFQNAEEMAKDLSACLKMISKSKNDFAVNVSITQDIETKFEEELKEKWLEINKEQELIEQEKLNFEREKLEAEKRNFEIEKLETERKALELAKKKLEIEKIKLENDKLEIEKKRIENENFKKEIKQSINRSFSIPKIINKELMQNDIIKQNKKYQESFENAKKYIETEDFDAAIGTLRTLIDTHPNIAEYHSNLGLALHLKGWEGYAQAEFKIALHFDPIDSLAIKYYKPTQNQENKENVFAKFKGYFKVK